MLETLYYSLLVVFLLANVEVSTTSTNEENCELRQPKPNTTVCDYYEHDGRLVCFHGLEDKWKSGGEDVKALVFCHWPLETFHPQDALQGFSSLRKLIITHGNLTKIASPFPSEAQSIEKINITGTRLKEFSESAFSNLSNLKTLDLRNNSFTEVDVAALNIPSLRRVYLSGNPLKCSEETKWILDQDKSSLARKIVDKENLRCSAPYEGRPLVPVVEIIKVMNNKLNVGVIVKVGSQLILKMASKWPNNYKVLREQFKDRIRRSRQTLKEECTRTVCDCELVYVVGHGGKHIQRQLMAFASVNCSHRYLTEMPGFLPANTTTLHLSGNKIRDLTPLTTNPAYRGVIDLYLDDNLIESIVKLDGSIWVDRFRLLSLRGNKLTDLPTYALENALQHNGNAVSLYLGNNSWRCDCLFTPGFQDLLVRYANLVKDINDVKCALENGDDNSGKIIRDLTRTEICMSTDEDPWLHPLDVLNIILAFLIFLIIGKLLYDYWFFKKTGKLPWIVAKIP